MDRKTFLYRASCAACLAGMGGIGTWLSSCGTGIKPFMEIDKKVRNVEIPFTAWDNNPVVVIARKGANNIAVTRKNNVYKAVALRCTHQGAGLKVKGEEFTCPLHGSKFSWEGKVLTGPAKEPLTTYDFQTGEGKIILQIREIT
jgi:Rieske Fe-S protein